MSAMQATRIVNYRERLGGYSAVEDLEKVPGFPHELVEELKKKLTV
jgi:competence ComEA-like helix-hairpin-helix protein